MIFICWQKQGRFNREISEKNDLPRTKEKLVKKERKFTSLDFLALLFQSHWCQFLFAIYIFLFFFLFLLFTSDSPAIATHYLSEFILNTLSENYFNFLHKFLFGRPEEQNEHMHTRWTRKFKEEQKKKKNGRRPNINLHLRKYAQRIYIREILWKWR